VVKHYQEKDQFFKVSIKRTQELKEANENNSILSAQLQELETKCVEESHLKEGKYLLPF
jgi:hypothetical protein